jgi:hypothetical protein
MPNERHEKSFGQQCALGVTDRNPGCRESRRRVTHGSRATARLRIGRRMPGKNLLVVKLAIGRGLGLRLLGVHDRLVVLVIVVLVIALIAWSLSRR